VGANQVLRLLGVVLSNSFNDRRVLTNRVARPSGLRERVHAQTLDWAVDDTMDRRQTRAPGRTDQGAVELAAHSSVVGQVL
jgi:hypothetical protein